MSTLADFTVCESSTILDALRAMDANCKGFVIVVDEGEEVAGILTDGDVRRALIRGSRPEAVLASCESYAKDFTYVREDIALDDLIDIFKDQRIGFLPILARESRKLVGVITKRQLHALLLQGRRLPPVEELVDVDESVNDFEIFARPWGIYKTTLLCDKFQQKILQIHPGAQLSLQYHRHREEHWVITSGVGVVQLDESTFPVHPGSVVYIPRGCRHRVTNTSETETLVMGEIQIGDYFGEDDIVRLEDIYGRVPRKE